MKIRNIIGIVASSFLMMLSSACSTEQGQDWGEESSAAPYSVRFHVGGSAVLPVIRASETHTADEKKVGSLYAVVFKDGTNAAKTGTNNAEIGTETFHKCVEVFKDGDLTTSEYIFEVGEVGAYQICFVANPDALLKAAIEGLASKTVADFKSLVVSQEPSAKPMLMTSGFYGAMVSGVRAANLGVVELTRVMARLDLVNKAPGVTVTQVVFKNRANKTKLIVDAVSSTAESNLEASKIYSLNLEGSVDGAEYKEQIYSYEQYGADAQAPSLDITYTIEGKNYVHTVEFKKDVQPVNLKRNHLYKVILTNNSGKLNLELSVADWNTGETFAVTNEEILGDLKPDYSQVKVGDFMLKDGTVISPDAPEFANKKQDAIGIVFYVGEARVGAKAKEKLFGKAHGLVMALKNAGIHLAWKNVNTTSGLPFKESMKDCYDDFDGYGNTQKIYQLATTNIATTHPAFNAVKNYSVAAPEGTTGWYLPAIGEWYDILENLGEVLMDEKFKTDESLKSTQMLTGRMVDGIEAANNINTKLRKATSNGNVDEFDVTYYSSCQFWSSSECGNNGIVRDMNFYNHGVLYVNSSGMTNVSGYRVRCVLAF